MEEKHDKNKLKYVTSSIVFIIGVILIILSLIRGCSVKCDIVESLAEIQNEEKAHDTIYIKEKIDTAGIILYCVKNGLYKNIFPVKKIVKTSFIEKPVFKTEFKDRIDTVYIEKKQVEEYYNDIIRYMPIPVKQHKMYVSLGTTTLPSLSVEAGIFMDKNWAVGFEGNYYYYNGIINNSVITNDVSLSIKTRSVYPSEEKIGVMEFPKFSVGLKVTKVF